METATDDKESPKIILSDISRQTLDIPGPEKRKEKREDTRSKIALYYVLGYILIVAAVLVIFAFKPGFVTEDLRDTLIAISGILSGPLGFIIGYYFKSHSDREE